MPSSKARQFEILRTVLAMAEERRSVALDEAAAATGLSVDELSAVLEPVLYLEFRINPHEIMGEERAFYLTSDDVLMLDQGHWLRNLRSDPPGPNDALRLLLAGITMQSIATGPTPDLDRAVEKLRKIVSTELAVPIDAPPCLAIARRAFDEGRSLRCRYLKDGATEPVDRELLPYRLFSKWGHWYFFGRDVREAAPKHFRVDRMLAAEVGEVAFDPPFDVELPDWFDLHVRERGVRVRMREGALASLPGPLRIDALLDLGNGRVEVQLTVTGERRLEHLLVCLEPDAEIVEPRQARVLQREHAAKLLEAYTSVV